MITEEERKTLKKSLSSHGLVEPLIWNEKTGNLVGGHQRLSVLDSVERSKDYVLTVSVVNLDEKREKALNIMMNNTNAQGSFDLDSLEKLLKETDQELAGFTDSDIVSTFGTKGALFDDAERLGRMAEGLKKFHEAKEAIRDKYKQKTDMNFYFVVVFKNRGERDAWMVERDLEPSRVISPDKLRLPTVTENK